MGLLLKLEYYITAINNMMYSKAGPPCFPPRDLTLMCVFFQCCSYMLLEITVDNSGLLYVRKQFPRRDGLQGRVECKVSWSNCPCGKTLPGFTPRCVLGHPSLAPVVFIQPSNECVSVSPDLNEAYVHPHMSRCEHVQFGIMQFVCVCVIFDYLCTAPDRILENISLQARGKKNPLEKSKYIYLSLPISTRKNNHAAGH